MSDGQRTLEQSELELRALRRVAATVSRSLDLDEVLRRCLDTTLEVGRAVSGGIYLYDARRETLVRLASRGVSEEVAPPFIKLPPSYQPATRFLDLDDPAQVTHPVSEAARREGLRRSLILPLVADRFVGLLGLNYLDPAPLSPETILTLEAITGQEAVAIANARAHRLVELRARLSDELRQFGERALAPPDQLDAEQLILETANKLVRGDRALYCVIQGATGRIVRAIGQYQWMEGREVPSDEPSLKEAPSRYSPFIVEDMGTFPAATAAAHEMVQRNQTASLVALPLRRRGQLVGKIFAGSGEPRHWEDEEIEAMRIFATMAAELLERERMEAQARDERRRLDAVIEHLPMVLALMRPSGEVTHMNAAGRALGEDLGHDVRLGWRAALSTIRREELDGRPIPAADSPIVEALAGKVPAPREVVLVFPDGSRRTVIGHAAPLFDAAGAVELVMVSYQDVTALRQLADAKDRFLRVASHELRSPITSLHATVSLLEMDPSAIADVNRRATLLARVQRQIDRLIKLVEQLFDTARLNATEVPLERVECDLVTLCEQAIDLTPTLHTGHRLVLEQDGPVLGRWDPIRLEQVVTNLLANALRYSAPGTEVTVRAHARGARAAVEVEDQGIGIPADQLDQVFSAFFRGSNAATFHKSGLGLGLHITAEIVRRHGGRIRVTSTEGHGSTFHVELPRSDEPIDAPTNAKESR